MALQIARHLSAWVFTLFLVAAVYVGWQIRDEYIVDAAYGTGYVLGITGGSMMLLLLVYPLKKRLPRSRWLLFSTPTWFRIHMFLGLVGPLLVLYHCNFSLGSTNSNVALASMLLMVSSGLVGRFIYSKIHHGLFGRKIEVKDLLDALTSERMSIDGAQSNSTMTDTQRSVISRYDPARFHQRSVFRSFGSGMAISLQAGRDARRLRKEAGAAGANPEQLQLLLRYLHTVRRLAGLHFYERLFSLWHMLHLPIFFMLLITAVVHVYAVHVY